MRRVMMGFMATVMVLSVAACSPPRREGMGGAQEPLYREEQTDTRYGLVRNDQINGHESAYGGGQNEIGFFRYQPENYKTDGKAPGPNVFVDRSLLARHISQMVTVLPNVKEATTLVTDDHIFVGIQTKNGKLDPKTVKEAKRTAESITPRYFKVHVTGNRTLEQQITRIGMRLNGNSDVEGVRGDLEQLLRKMGDNTPPDVNESIYPQHRKQVNPEED
ncbi:YhcN/YlaJ family sporulation lipoprotein [Paenactinomyces guangxiensis]|uniref:YhcN/YlaJ family sporulation lipoprotein n=1 Tax=Paenactinomyces guangxiensis TaxID=1490290 RepID=A0A7W1WPH5_9BACL|nr:YhcN/YlaJ family sporulation lipoprotein [Paenactinomyces guangxiensis]MBA4493703.1 YhcN/YlaJ family sporulation lipoprotein [Paenactinomyces guangxiensis]MBH8590990.1 YhcN/YlaJ family sporulation lipoprotein [Paenactinomyces guangxiensis]